MHSLAIRRTFRLGLALLLGITILVLVQGADAETTTKVFPSGNYCYEGTTSPQRFYNEKRQAYGKSTTYYHNAQGGCSPQLAIWYMYLETKGWNNAPNWHLEDSDIKSGYTTNPLQTKWVNACDGPTECSGHWYVTSYDFFQETQGGSTDVIYTSHDGCHSSYTWWVNPPGSATC